MDLPKHGETVATNPPLYTQISKTTGMRYTVALLATVVALLVRLELSRFLDDYLPYITLFPSIAFCAWYCGVGPSIVSVVLALIGTKYWFIPPVHSLRIVGTERIVGILAFSLASGILVAMGEARRRREEALSAAQVELEQAVR
jgi:K+-sensing histidine kinase KdpD